MTKSPILLLFALPFVTFAQSAELPTTTFESAPPWEATEITELVDLTHKLLEQRYGAGSGETMARRAVHPKAHGCVQADFTVNKDIPEQYRAGLFATPGKSYKAWVRFSNATAIVRPDIDNGAAASRGMAIKVMGVEGDTLMNEPGGKTQDFLFINQKMFAFPNVHEYLEFTRIQFAKKEDARAFFAPPLSDARTRIRNIVGMIQATHIANPLHAAYFSASPFLFGKDRAAKFAAQPRNAPAPPSAAPAGATTDYLREAMKKSLDSGDAVFDFQVQLRPAGLEPFDANYPIESANDEWKEDAAARFQIVATITIPKQNFDTPLQNTECEHLVFTPWHGLTTHRPLGGINRLRREVYVASSRHRADHREPTDYPKWP